MNLRCEPTGLSAVSGGECPCCQVPRLSRRGFLAGVGAAGMASLVPALGAEAGEALLEPRLTLKTAGHGARTVALTLDACPGGFDEALISNLIAWRVPATLFMTGAWIHANPRGLDVILRHPDLFSIGNHGAKHIPAVLGQRTVFGLKVAGDTDAIRDEIARGEDAIVQTTGQRPAWYRGAAALYSPAAFPVIETMGLSVAGFSLNADMGASLPASVVAARIQQAVDGDVIIAHMNQPHRLSGPGVSEGVRRLLAEGVTFIRLEAETPSIAVIDTPAKV